MEGACFYFPLNGGWLIRGGGLNRGRGLNCYSVSAPTVRTYLRMPKIQITNYWTLAKFDHSQHINYSMTFKENKIDLHTQWNSQRQCHE